MNIVEHILRFNAGRESERLALKYRAMRANPFAFYRGTCHLFYDRLPDIGLFRSAPAVWSCGDLHLENFGSYKGDNRLVYFDINDFDEAAMAPATVDLVRATTSLVVAGTSAKLGNASTDALLQNFLMTYRQTLAAGKSLWVEAETSHGMIRELFDQASQHTRATFLDRRTKRVRGRRRLRVDGIKQMAVTPAIHAEVVAFVDSFARTQPQPEFFQVLDVARRVAGTGSLGVDRFAILVEGKGSPDANYLLDLKAALPSVAAMRWPTLQPAWASQAQRICSIQYRMQAIPMAFLHAVPWKAASYVLRALQPSEHRILLPTTGGSIDQLLGVVGTMGQCLASAQLRSSGRQGSAIADVMIAFAGKKKWPLRVSALAHQMARTTSADWQTFCVAYDGGRFDVIDAAPKPECDGRATSS